MRVIVCGSRDWEAWKLVTAALAVLPANTLVAHGACRGADEIAGRMAKAMRLPTVEFPADWNRYGVSAGPKRNRAMFRAIEPHLVIAFHDDLKYSKGTRHMVGLCGTKVPALIFTTQDSEEEIRRRTRMLLRRMKARV